MWCFLFFSLKYKYQNDIYWSHKKSIEKRFANYCVIQFSWKKAVELLSNISSIMIFSYIPLFIRSQCTLSLPTENIKKPYSFLMVSGGRERVCWVWLFKCSKTIRKIIIFLRKKYVWFLQKLYFSQEKSFFLQIKLFKNRYLYPLSKNLILLKKISLCKKNSFCKTNSFCKR